MALSMRQSQFWQFLRARRQQLLTLCAATILPFWIFAAIAEDVVERERMVIDEPILRYVHTFTSPAADASMLLLSGSVFQLVVIWLAAAIFLLLLWSKEIRDAIFFGSSVIGAMFFSQTIKLVFGRARPTLWLSPAAEHTWSFPSGHAMETTAFVVALIVLAWSTRWRYPVIVVGSSFVALVSLSRIYLGVHYPTDILAGWAASFVWVIGLSSVLYGQIGKPPSRTGQGAGNKPK